MVLNTYQDYQIKINKKINVDHNISDIIFYYYMSYFQLILLILLS